MLHHNMQHTKHIKIFFLIKILHIIDINLSILLESKKENHINYMEKIIL